MDSVSFVDEAPPHRKVADLGSDKSSVLEQAAPRHTRLELPVSSMELARLDGMVSEAGSEDKFKQRKKTGRDSQRSSVLLLLAIIECVVGFAFPISLYEKYDKASRNAYYFEVFLILQYAVSLVSLFYLQCLLCKGNLSCFKNVRLSVKNALKSASSSPSLAQMSEAQGEWARQGRASSASLNLAEETPIEQPSEVTLSPEKASKKATFEDEADFIRPIDSMSWNDSQQDDPACYLRPKQHPDDSIFSRDGEGVNLYLRFGLVAFGFGVMTMDGFKIADFIELSSQCHTDLWVPKHLLHFGFVFLQTFFVFKHHRVIFHKKKFLVRFILVHLAVVNLCQWIKTVTDEIRDEHVKESQQGLKMPHHVTAWNQTGHHKTVDYDPKAHNQTQTEFTSHGQSCHSLSLDLGYYLSPCAIEYSLISSAIFYKIFQKIGNADQDEDKFQARERVESFAECHRSHRGLFFGLLLFIATIVAMALFFTMQEDTTKVNDKNHAITLYQLTELSLLFIGFCTSVLCFCKIRHLEFHNLTEEGAFDGNLLLVGYIGVLFYDLFLIIGAKNGSEASLPVGHLSAAKGTIEILQAFAQTFVIMEASRRCARDIEDVKSKPGRTLVVLLLIVNLSMWVVNIFEVKRASARLSYIQYYGKTYWSVIINVTLPLIIFFRFHSTVCLSDVWINAYKIRRTVPRLRTESP